MKSIQRFFLAVLASALVAVPLLADGHAGAHSPVDVNAAGLAVDGADLVELYRTQKVVAGSSEFVTSHGGATYRFASAANLATFVAAPDTYLPLYGGFCAVGTGYGKFFPVDLTTAVVVDGRLYLNKNAEVAQLFAGDRANWIAKAEAAWPELSRQTPPKP